MKVGSVLAAASQRRSLGGSAVLLLALCVTFALAWASSAYAGETTAPHVPFTADTDVCAMCHRSHAAASDAWYRFLSGGGTGSALLVVPTVGLGDTAMCYVCHGVGALGAEVEVESAFEASSSHRLVPYASTFGPSPKQCSDCHDSHGSERDASGTPYPALLRSVTSTGAKFTSGEEFCAVCHYDRPLDSWDGIEVWRQTAHAKIITPPVSGTGIRCSSCHDPHGSPYAPSIVTSVFPPAAPASASVTGNNRTLCLACHALEHAAWSGPASYAVSAHGSTFATVALSGEWPSRNVTPSTEATRLAGECQACHAPMGRKDASGNAIPHMVDAIGRELCDRCHDADGPSMYDLASSQVTEGISSQPELAVVWQPSEETSQHGRVAVFPRDVTSTVPAALIGPREYFSFGHRTGDATAGDIDSDGCTDLVVVDRIADRLDVWSPDHQRGISKRFGPGTLGIEVRAHLVAVADVFWDGTGLPEVVVVERSGASPYPSSLIVYRYDGAGLTTVTGPVAVGNDASSIAVGNVTGTAAEDIAVTAAGDDRLRVLTESTVTPGTLVAGGPYVTRSRPRGASIGDVHSNDGAEIVVLNAGEVTGQVSLFSGAGASLGDFSTATNAGAEVAYDSLCADVLPGVTPAGTSGLEVLVVSRSEPVVPAVNAISSLNVFRQLSAGGLDTGTRQKLDTGAGYESSTLAAGDVDGDGRAEAYVGNAGRWLRGGTARSASVQVFRADAPGTSLLASSDTRWAGGVERSGLPPAVIVADLGLVGPSRHPVGADPGTHVTTEPLTAARHVECADCHNPHEATATVAAAAPYVYGELKGVWGVRPTYIGPGADIAFELVHDVDYEYEVCLRCHSDSQALEGARNVASEVNTTNPSAHSAVAPSQYASNTAGSFVTEVPAWSAASILYCTDCHGDVAASAVRGVHQSDVAPMLRWPFFGTLPGDPADLCFMCHKRTVYFTGAEDSTATASNSMFYDPTLPERRLHKLHTNDYGFGCRACHVSHGSASNYHLQSTGNLYQHADNGGACTTPCHTGGGYMPYARTGVAPPPITYTALPTAYSVPVGNTDGGYPTGNLASLQATDGDSLVVRELDGASSITNPRFDIRIGFTGLPAAPRQFITYARYEGDPSHIVNVQAWDFNAGVWVTLGNIPSSASFSTYTFDFPTEDFFASGQTRMRIIHPSSGDTNHYLHIDVARVSRY